jgi:glutamate synthase domain-containing protein 3
LSIPFLKVVVSMRRSYDERELLPLLLPASGHPSRIVKCKVSPVDHHVGEELSRQLHERYSQGEQPPEKHLVHFIGSAGNYFGNGLASGLTFVADSIGSHGCAAMRGGVVVLLSAPGKHFGEDIQCGCAYVYDDGGQLLNNGAQGSPFVQRLMASSAEAQHLKALIAQHAERTGSLRASQLLADWNTALKSFIRVTAAP